MRRLLLLRHAKTESDAPSGSDRDRPLAARGHKDAAELGAWLAGRRSLLPDLALISTAVRARETWDIVQQLISDRRRLRVLPQHLPDLYGAEPTQLLAIIRSAATDDPERLMIVGHNPGLHEIALGLIGGGDARRARGAGRQSADVGTRRDRLCHRELGWRRVPGRTARAVRQSETAEGGVTQYAQSSADQRHCGVEHKLSRPFSASSRYGFRRFRRFCDTLGLRAAYARSTCNRSMASKKAGCGVGLGA